MTEKDQQSILQQITSSVINTHQLFTDPNIKQTHSDDDSVAQLADIIEISTKIFNFGDCLPGSVHEQDLNIKVKQDLPNPVNLYLYISCQDPILNELPQLIFGVRKKLCYEYFDELKFRISKKGQYNFIVGAKAPNLYQHLIKCKMYVWIDGYSEEAIQMNLQMKIKLPTISCMKELTSNQNRVIKLCTIKNKPKKQCRIPFKHHDSGTTSIEMEMIGLQNSKSSSLVIDVKPRMLSLAGKGQFFLTLTANFNEQIKNKVQGNPQGHSERRILLIKVKNSNCYFHFPVQAIFYDSNKNNSDTD